MKDYKLIINTNSKKYPIYIGYNILKSKYEKYHRVKYTSEALKACISLSERYLSERYLPDKAIDIMDEAGARAHLTNFKIPRLITKIEKEISELKKEKESKVLKQLFEEAAVIRDKEKKVNIKLDNENKKWELKELKNIVEINFENIADIVSSMTEIPLSKIKKIESNQLLNLDKKLKKHIIGQGKAIDVLVKAVKRSRTGINNPERPGGVFLFLGPTGVGKTELAKVFARNVYIKKDSIIKIDMSEFKQEFTSSRLIGSPPGYIGYEKGGELTEKVRRNPYSVILFDEIEKAHPSIFNIFLQIFDEGTLTDSLGRKINFRNSIIIMTSNMGTKKITNKGYDIGGKTGTAELINSQNDYDKDLNRTIFVSAFPMSEPKYLILSFIDKPKRKKENNYSITSATVNAPLVKDILIKIIEIFQLPKIDNKQILNAATSIKYKQINAIN